MPAATKPHRAFAARRLFSITGVVPIGAFLVSHLYEYAHGIGGRDALEASLIGASRAPYRLAFEILLIWAPLLFHAVLGLRMTASSRPNAGRYAISRNWLYTMQRVTGGAALLFIAWHVWHFRVPIAMGRMADADVFPRLCASLSSTVAGGVPLVAIGYLLGVAACVFHLANGVWGFAVSFGITVTERAQRISSALCGAAGVAVFAIGAHTVIYFATGSDVLGLGPRSPRGAVTRCTDVVPAGPVVAIEEHSR